MSGKKLSVQSRRNKQQDKRHDHTAALLFLPASGTKWRELGQTFQKRVDHRESIVLVDQGNRTLTQLMKLACSGLRIPPRERSKLCGSTLSLGLFMTQEIATYSMQLPMSELCVWAEIGVNVELTIYRTND
jgi:hypothetical protein